MAAEAVLSAVLKELLSKLSSLVQNEIGLLWGLEEDKKKLESNLSVIRAVLHDAEMRQVKEMAVRDWLGKLKDAAYDAEDLVDEFICEARRRKVVNQQGMQKKVFYNMLTGEDPIGSQKATETLTLCYNNFRRSPPSSCARKNLVASCLKKNLPCSRKAQCDCPKVFSSLLSLEKLKSLEHLTMSRCPDVMNLLHYAESLTSLTWLEILNCPGTWALPESVGDLTLNVYELQITQK